MDSEKFGRSNRIHSSLLIFKRNTFSRQVSNDGVRQLELELINVFMCVTDEWLRPVMRKDKQVLVHWGNFPDR